MPHFGLSAFLSVATSCGLLTHQLTACDATTPSVPDAISALRQAAIVYDEAAMKTAVAHLVRSGRSALPQVHQLVHHDDANVRWKAIETLGAIGVADPRLCPDLLTCSRDADADVRGAAIDVLAQLFPQNALTQKAVTRLRRDPHPLVRVRAAAAQWTTRQDLRAVEALAAALPDADWMAAREASFRLASIGSPATPVLLTLLEKTTPQVQRAALLTLAKFPQLPPTALHKIRPLSISDDPLLFPAAMKALLACGNAGQRALETCCLAVKVPQRVAALTTLATSATAAPVVRRLVLQSLSDPADACQLAALAVIARHRIASPELLQPCVKRLLHPSADHRAAAIAALAVMGSPAQPALPVLRQLADREPVDYIRRAARRLAQRLDTRATPPQD